MKIVEGDLRDPKIVALLRFHATTAAAQTEPGSAHALDADGLSSPDIEFWAAWDDAELLGFAALKQLLPGHGEIKSMHVVQTQRRRGTGKALLDHLIERARAKGMQRLSLETGSWDYFRAAQALYKNHGFVECAPFGDYRPDRNSIFMTLELP
ncbi:MAG TPA: GNAT family N-acetyltransferase [Rhizomicrobium sp.]|jgi:putative acetyltransferase|nr:GNAT family N-acetyltransferase [Rhizomicrobium sp.]